MQVAIADQPHYVLVGRTRVGLSGASSTRSNTAVAALSSAREKRSRRTPTTCRNTPSPSSTTRPSARSSAFSTSATTITPSVTGSTTPMTVAPAVVWETLPIDCQVQVTLRLARLLAALVEASRDE